MAKLRPTNEDFKQPTNHRLENQAFNAWFAVLEDLADTPPYSLPLSKHKVRKYFDQGLSQALALESYVSDLRF